MSEPGSYEYELGRALTRPKTKEVVFTLACDSYDGIRHEDLARIVTLGAALLASDTSVKIILRRMTGVRSYEHDMGA